MNTHFDFHAESAEIGIIIFGKKTNSELNVELDLAKCFTRLTQGTLRNYSGNHYWIKHQDAEGTGFKKIERKKYSTFMGDRYYLPENQQEVLTNLVREHPTMITNE